VKKVFVILAIGQLFLPRFMMNSDLLDCRFWQSSLLWQLIIAT